MNTIPVQERKPQPVLLGALLVMLGMATLPAQGAKSAESPPGNLKTVTVGAFAVQVPGEWSSFATAEAAALRSQFLEQSRQIYQQFSGRSDPAKSVDLAAFHIEGAAGSFVIVSLTTPPQSDLIKLLKSEVPEKMSFGIHQGYIRKYLGMTSVEQPALSGFYTRAIGTKGNIEVSGALEHKKLRNTIIQLTLLSPGSWDEAKASGTLSALLKTVVLNGK